MIVKKMGRSHIDECSKIQLEVFGNARNDNFAKCYSDKNYNMLIALDEANKVVGYLILLYVVDVAEIIAVAVLKDSRRQGAGSALVEKSFSVAKRLGAGAVVLEVNENNVGARKLYERSGFVAISVRKKYYNNSDDAIIMKCEI